MSKESNLIVGSITFSPTDRASLSRSRAFEVTGKPLREMPSRPDLDRFKGSWRNKKNRHTYELCGAIFNSNNGVDRWDLVYRRQEDSQAEMPFCRSPEEFLEKFERIK